MALVVGIIVVVLIVAICAQQKKGTTQGKGSASANNQNNQHAYDMVWPRPKQDNLWDSFDYFVRLGEVWARQRGGSDEGFVYLSLQMITRDQSTHLNHHGERGYFELRTEVIDSLQRSNQDIPYLQEINQRFIGFDPTTSILTMEQSEIRNLVFKEASHATDVRIERFGDNLSIKVKFRCGM